MEMLSVGAVDQRAPLAPKRPLLPELIAASRQVPPRARWSLAATFTRLAARRRCTGKLGNLDLD